MTKNPGKLPQAKKSTPPEENVDLTLEQIVDRKIGDLVPQGARAQVVSQITSVMTAEFFSGPIAHPRHLREYEYICPGSADRIISMAEKRNQHLIDMDVRVQTGEEKDQKRGMDYGAGLFGILIVAALTTAVLELEPIVTGMFLGTAAIGGVGLFIKGRNGVSKQDERSPPPDN